MSKKPPKLIEVFFSYSHEDEELRDELEKHLSILKRQGVITGWHDRRIGAGGEWEGEIDTHLNTAHVILLLISADFLASDYCYDVEMKRAMERHEAREARVIPVILRPVDWRGALFGKLQALPKNAKPVTSWSNPDEAFFDVARGIRAAVEELVGPSAGPLPSKRIEDFSKMRQAYFDYLIREYKDHVIRGFSPRVSGRDVSLSLAKIFLPLQATEGRPPLAEYAEEDLLRQAISGAMGELDWQRRSLEMEKRAARLSTRQAAQRPLTLAELLDSSRAILLGDPGTGKTTVTRYVTYALAAGDHTHIGRSVLGLTPVLIRLANYGKAFERDSTMHLVEYVEQELTPKPEFGQYLRQAIEAGQCLIILDGLDEVTDPGLRIRVTERIQTMVASYNSNWFLVTSRIIGYDRSPLTREFKHATLKELGPEDQARFVELWYEALQAEITGGVHHGAARDLIEALRTKPQIGRLAANPLLLTIMVLMHWRGVKLPSRRVEIYQTATDTLIEYWTTHREGVDLDAYEIKAILAPIAHYILSSNVGGVIAHYDLLPRFHQGIVEQRGCDPATARRLGRDLLKALGEQSGIFLERGLDADGQPVYGFLHQTFGEYLAALHMANEVLSGTFEIETYIHHTMWHEPFLLLAGHLSLVSQTHVSLLIRQILDFDSPYEEQLQRNVLLAADCLADDIQIKPDLCQEVLTRLARLLQHKAPQVRQAAVDDYRRLAMTRHHEAAITILKSTLDQVEDINKLSPEIRFSLAQAFIHLDEQAVAKPLLWPLDSERYEREIRQDKIQRLCFEGWPDQAADYLRQLHGDKNRRFYVMPDLNLSSFILGPVDAASARQILGEDNLRKLIDKLVSNTKDKKDRANLHLLAALAPETPNIEALTDLLTPETPAQARCLAAIRLLESEHRPDAIATLRELIATEPGQAPRAAQALLAINETANLDWQLLRDTALIGDDDNAPQAIGTLLQAGKVAIALPAALHLLAVYPPETRQRREVRLWPVVEALIEHGHTAVGLSAARWLALRPGYYFRLQACEALLEAGQVESTIPILQYLAYECHDESSQEACQRLLLLKEADRLVPLLAQVSNSDTPEMCYHACLALALIKHTPETCKTVARPRSDLKVAVLDEQAQAYQTALQEFCQAGLTALEALEATDDQSQSFQAVSRLGLSLLPESAVPADRAQIIGELLNSPWPAVVVNAALFDLRAGRVERPRERLVKLLGEVGQTLSLPVRLKALTTLGQIVGPETTALLIQALANEDSRVRQCAVRALGPLGDPNAVQPLITTLNDEDEDVHAFAARVLGELGDPAAIQPLIAALNDKDDGVRWSAADALGKLGDPVSLQPLIAALDDEYSGVRASAARALGQLGNLDAIQPLVIALGDNSSEVRRSVADALSELNAPGTAQILITALKDTDETVRWSAAQSLAQLGDSAAIQPLMSALKDESGIVRGLAAWALCTFGQDPSVVEILIAAVKDKDSQIYIPAAFTLGYLGNTIATQPLIDALNNEDENTRIFAAEALWRLGDPNTAKILTATLYDEEPSIRQLAVFALGKLIERNSFIIPHLIAALGDEHSSVRGAVVEALGKINDPTILKSLMTTPFDGDNTERSSMAEAVGRLGMSEYTPLFVATSVADYSWRANQYAKAVIHLDPASALPVLDRYALQFRRKSWVKWSRGQAMWRLGDMEAALTSLRKAVEQEDNSTNLLALAHFHLEQSELQLAREYVDHALKKARHYERDICLLSQAVIQWLMGETETGLATLKKAQQRNRHITRVEDLQYDYFWREKAITALEAMLAELETQYT